MKTSFSHDISLRPLCKAHTDELALSLRPEDLRELWAAYRLPAREGLDLCRARSVFSAAFLYRGRVAAAAGAAAENALGTQACLWLWTGKEVQCCRKSFWKAYRAVLECWLARYPHAYAVCDVRYVSAARCLTRMGARGEGKAFLLAGKETRFQLYRFGPARRMEPKI